MKVQSGGGWEAPQRGRFARTELNPLQVFLRDPFKAAQENPGPLDVLYLWPRPLGLLHRIRSPSNDHQSSDWPTLPVVYVSPDRRAYALSGLWPPRVGLTVYL